MVSSFKTNLELINKPFLLPKVWQIQNYVNAFQLSDLHLLFLHSIVVSGCGHGPEHLRGGSMASYALSRFRFGLNNLILSVILAGVLIPIIALMVPYFQLISKIGIYDSLVGADPDLCGDQPADIGVPHPRLHGHGSQGAGGGGLDRRLFVLAALRPDRLSPVPAGVVTAGTFVFLYAWNEFIYALLLTSSVQSQNPAAGHSLLQEPVPRGVHLDVRRPGGDHDSQHRGLHHLPRKDHPGTVHRGGQGIDMDIYAATSIRERTPLPVEIVETDVDLYYHIALTLYLEIEQNNAPGKTDVSSSFPVGPVYQYRRFVWLCRHRPLDLSRLHCFFMDEYLDEPASRIDLRTIPCPSGASSSGSSIEPMPPEMNLRGRAGPVSRSGRSRRLRPPARGAGRGRDLHRRGGHQRAPGLQRSLRAGPRRSRRARSGLCPPGWST